MIIKPKFAVAATLAAALATSGCTTMMDPGGRGFNTTAGAVLGGAAGAVLSGGVKDRTTRGAIIGAGAIGGALVGRQFEPDCVNRTDTNISRQIYGNNTSQWQGNQTYSENCIGSGAQDVPRADLPSSVQTRGWSNN